MNAHRQRQAARLYHPLMEAGVAGSSHGGVVRFRSEGPKRRVLELDRDGQPIAWLRWRDDGALAQAAVRSTHGDWIGIEPRAAAHPLWGASDRLWRLSGGRGWQPIEPLTVFEALPWAAIDCIPPLAEPARLPPGAGTAVLNLLGAVAQDQGVSRLSYRGPYPTEQLFTALLESFRFVPDGDDPLGRFLDGTLRWIPAPHQRRFPAEGVGVQLRAGVEKVVVRGRAYYRTEWQSVRRHAPRRVHDVGDTVVCSLWALGAPVEDHLVLDREGGVIATLAPAPDPRRAAPLAARITSGVEAVLRATSAPALATEIREVMGTLTLEWGSVPGDLVEVGNDRARVSWRLHDAGAARMRSASARVERLGWALELLGEVALLLGDHVRARAQAALAARPLEVQRAALERTTPPSDAAAVMAAGAAALAAALR